MELDPQVAFERLFGAGGTAAERAARREQDRSILDSVTESLARFKKDLGPSDRSRLDGYETDIRELERRGGKRKKEAWPPFSRRRGRRVAGAAAVRCQGAVQLVF